jgi:hypothetical protein
MTGGLPLAKLVRRVCEVTQWPVTVVGNMPIDQLLAWSETTNGEISPEQAIHKINERRSKRGLPPLDSL